MADKASKAKATGSMANGSRAKATKPPPLQPQQQHQKMPKADAEDNDDENSMAVLDLLASHEKELLTVAAALTSETSLYDGELRQLSVKLELANRRLMQLERRFPTAAVWRIGGFLETFQEARAGRGRTLTSPPYYLSRQGYRLAMSIGLNGDGRARGKCISLYASICRGDFDGSLTWPFPMRIYLSILDQTDDEEPRRNFTKVIIPRHCPENRAFLGRPTAEQNPRFGFEDFVSLDEFLKSGRHYVRNDALFVKMELPSEDLPQI